MQKWEYMFVRHFDGRIMEIEDDKSVVTEFKKPKDQPVWTNWLRERGLDGWKLVSEYTLNKSDSVHATLVRSIGVFSEDV
jgi:hypothetical protein